VRFRRGWIAFWIVSVSTRLYAAVSEIEGHFRPRIAGRLGTPDWAALPFIPLAACLLMGVPHLRIRRRDGHGASVFCRGVLVHCPSRLSATVTVRAAELLCGDGMFTKRTLECAKTVHHFDGVISHSFKCSRLSRSDSEPKLPSLLLVFIICTLPHISVE